MKKKIYTVILALGTLALTSACDSSPKKAKENSAQSNNVETFSLKKQKIQSEILLPGELSGYRQVDIHAKVDSYVKSLKVDIGDEVKKGQLLMELDAPEIYAQLAAAKSRFHSQEAKYMASSNNYDRILKTSKVEGTISQNDLDQALARKNGDYADLQAAKAAYQELQSMKEYLRIIAPFKGTVAARNVNIGAFVGQSNTPLLSIIEQRKLRLAVLIPDAYTGYLNLGDELSFKVNSLPGETFTASVSRMSGALDLKLRSERVELDINNENKRLLPGMIAEITLPLYSKNDNFIVPLSTIMNTTEGIYVIKIKDSKAQWVKVNTGLSNKDSIEIFSNNLNENDNLVSFAAEEIRNGSIVHMAKSNSVSNEAVGL
ncbi:efflux RND transporter periplasmic adaptor subunit [Maribacter thermophilus]|uniref:efflux RND transporter periplasmic adaptor subunit n=1 Tax=Maribacter thermophilus TaxID=1197874 RepID=UPI0006412F32|nr:efflux RND transporter periplasmic adaptor subunit [Maribacter thermophilus]